MDIDWRVKRVKSSCDARTRFGCDIRLSRLDSVDTLEKGVEQRDLARGNDLVEASCLVHVLDNSENLRDELVARLKEWHRVALLLLGVVDASGVLVKPLKQRLELGQHRQRILVRVDVARHQHRRHHRANEREVEHARVLGARQHSVQTRVVDAIGQQAEKLARKTRKHQRNLLAVGRRDLETLVRELAVEVDAQHVQNQHKLDEHREDVVKVVLVCLNVSPHRKLVEELGAGEALEVVHARLLLTGVDSTDHRIDVREVLAQQTENTGREKLESLREGVLDACKSKSKGGAEVLALFRRNELREVDGDRDAFALRCQGNRLAIELNHDTNAGQSREVRLKEHVQVVGDHEQTLGPQATTCQVLHELRRQTIVHRNLEGVVRRVETTTELVENLLELLRKLGLVLVLVEEAVHRHDDDEQNLRHLVRRKTGLGRLVVDSATSRTGLGLVSHLGKNLVGLVGRGGLDNSLGRRGGLKKVVHVVVDDLVGSAELLDGLGNQLRNLVGRNGVHLALKVSEANLVVGLKGFVTLVGLKGLLDGGRVGSHDES